MIPLPQLVPLIGTEAYHLRPSALDKLVHCQVWHMLSLGEDDEGGPAAQNGSLTHAAVAAYHEEPDDAQKIARAIEAIGLNSHKFPLADQNEVRLNVTPYISDPRNSKANVIACEHAVTLKLDPHPLDRTGEPIIIKGTLDQIRLENGVAKVCDLKTGGRGVVDMIHCYAYQQAAYTLAARQSGFPNCEPGYLIRTKGYRTRGAMMPSPDGVMCHLPFDVEGAWALMDRVRLVVAMLRMGNIEYGPGSWCSFCPHGGLVACQPKAKQKLFAAPATTPAVSVPLGEAPKIAIPAALAAILK